MNEKIIYKTKFKPIEIEEDIMCFNCGGSKTVLYNELKATYPGIWFTNCPICKGLGKLDWCRRLVLGIKER